MLLLHIFAKENISVQSKCISNKAKHEGVFLRIFFMDNFSLSLDDNAEKDHAKCISFKQ